MITTKSQRIASSKIFGSNFKPAPLPLQVAAILSDAILEGRLKGGEQLIETKLQEEFGISRTPLREAFRELEKRGLVEILPRRGTFVRTLTQKDIDDNFPVRSVLEGLAARQALARISREELEELSDALAGMEIAANADNGKAYLENHVQFHEVYISASENEVLINTLRTLRMHTIWHRFYFKYHQEDYEKSLAIHHKILELLSDSDSDPQFLEEIVREHIMAGYDRFRSYLEENVPGGTV
jgi:DNA-binding GntR family transcriptional regulator